METRLTAQETKRGLYTFSSPLSKFEASEFITRVISGASEELKWKIALRLANTISDEDFVRSFNNIMTIKLCSFAPGMYRIRYINL